MKKAILVLALALLALPLTSAADTGDYQAILDGANAALAGAGSDMRVFSIEWMTEDLGDPEAQNTVFARNVGNKQLSSDWVPFDPRRTWNVSDAITYLVDQSDGATLSGLSSAQTEAAIDRAMALWDVDTTCSAASIVKVADDGSDPDFVDFLLGIGAPGGTFADITHGGWLAPNILPPSTIGVTFTLIWVDGLGLPTDINADGKTDTALREIYYNQRFFWRIDANVDVETVAAHEVGHGLSQGHFGTIFASGGNGKLHFSPRALMNAAYGGVLQELTGSDDAGHCSIWGDWPNH